MKRVSAWLACLLAFALVLPAQAGGYGHGIGRGGHSAQHWGAYGHGSHYDRHYRGSRHAWVAPVLGAALVGSVIYATSSHSYAAPVVVEAPYVPPQRVAYFCPISQQYYPNVPTCQVPWQLVSY